MKNENTNTLLFVKMLDNDRKEELRKIEEEQDYNIRCFVIKQVPIRIDDELHKKLKIITIKNDTTIQKLVEDFLKKYVAEHEHQE